MEEILKELPFSEAISRFICEVDGLISCTVIQRHKSISSSPRLMELGLPYDPDDAFTWPSCIAGVSSVMMGGMDSLVRNDIKVVFGFVSIDGQPDTRSHHVYFISEDGIIVDWLAGQFTCQMGPRGKVVKSNFVDRRIFCGTSDEARELGIHYDGYSYVPREILSISSDASRVIHPNCLALGETT